MFNYEAEVCCSWALDVFLSGARLNVGRGMEKLNLNVWAANVLMNRCRDAD